MLFLNTEVNSALLIIAMLYVSGLFQSVMQDFTTEERKEFKDAMKNMYKGIINSEFEQLVQWSIENKIPCFYECEGILFHRKRNGIEEFLCIDTNLKVKFKGIRKEYKYRLESAKKLLSEAF